MDFSQDLLQTDDWEFVPSCGNNLSSDGYWKKITNLVPCNPFSQAKTDPMEHPIEIGTDVLNFGGDTTVSKFPRSYSTRFSNSNQTASLLKTLEDSFRYFKFDPSLQILEESLENVRRGKKTVEDHNSLIKRLEKSIFQRSKEHHPDKIQSRGGSEEEMFEAQRLQTVLNSTKKAMNILNKIFLEDIDVDHKYGFYTNLDISLLGNEDEIESHVYEVLFKISLVSEIKQRHIISEIRNFLTESQSCIMSYIDERVEDFEKYFSLAIFRLKQCIRGYKKLLKELEEVEEECMADEQNNIYSLIRKMRIKCSKQLGHLNKLSDAVDLCLKGTFQIFTCSEQLDDYFVYPFVCYINVLLMCSVFVRRPSKSKFEKVMDQNKFLPVPIYNDQTRFLTSLYYLTSYYFGSNKYELAVQNLLKQKYFRKNSVKEKFLDILLEKNEFLMNKFKIKEYNENGSRRYVLEELKKCKEMKSEFEEKKRQLVEDIALVKKDTEEMSQQLNKLMSNQEERRKEYEACLAGNSELQEKFALRKKNAEGMMNERSDKVMSNREERHKQYESSAGNSELQEKLAPGKENTEGIMNQRSDKIMSDKEECPKEYKACITENSSFQARFALGNICTENVSQQLDKIMSDKEERREEYEACLAYNSELQARFADGKKNTVKVNQQSNKIMNDREERRKEYEACLAENSELQARFQEYLRKKSENS